MNLNKVIIVGRMTATPELRKTPGGQSVTSFSVATNRVWTDRNGAKQEDTEFTNVVVWGKQAEVATMYLIKGSLVLIEGRLTTRSFQDKQGNDRKVTEVIAERIQLGPKPQPKTETQTEVPIVSLEEQKDEAHFDTGQEDGSEIKPEELPF